MQHSCYSKALWTVVKVARERFLDAESFLRCDAPMSIQVRQLNSIDHRTVQDVHDLVAAWYRFKRRSERLFPLEPNLKEDWTQFLRAELHALSRSADFVTGVLDACIHANTEIGYAGEKRAKRVQRERYWTMFEYTLPHSLSEVEP
jgi:hypothetical protein